MFDRGSRILIVDDLQTIRELVKNVLQTLGYHDLLEAENGMDALKILVQQLSRKKPIDLMICDWNMPELSGVELLKQLRSTPEFGRLPFILLTSESEKDLVTEAVLAGTSQYIIKPFTAKIFEEKLLLAWKKHHPQNK